MELGRGMRGGGDKWRGIELVGWRKMRERREWKDKREKYKKRTRERDK